MFRSQKSAAHFWNDMLSSWNKGENLEHCWTIKAKLLQFFGYSQAVTIMNAEYLNNDVVQEGTKMRAYI